EDPDALNNIKIGEFRVEGLRDVPAGNIITLTLGLDLNGILQVSAQEKETGLEKNITIKNALSQFESGALETAKQRINSLFGQIEPGIIEQEFVVEPLAAEIIAAQQLISKAEALFDKVSSEDKEDMVDLIEALTHYIETKDIAELEKPTAELNDIIYYLES
ncbi:MAG: Hsp70 family protein, partial [Methyloprofundus sp.]|nr:Hsp70 family protein [Methyloprofundus sp.]